jgi:hypothetical protein
MGADSVLVNAALNLGMSRVPKDTAEIFNKQYEGLIAYNAAKANELVVATKAGLEGARAISNLAFGTKIKPLDFEGEEKKAYFSNMTAKDKKGKSKPQHSQYPEGTVSQTEQSHNPNPTTDEGPWETYYPETSNKKGNTQWDMKSEAEVDYTNMSPSWMQGGIQELPKKEPKLVDVDTEKDNRGFSKSGYDQRETLIKESSLKMKSPFKVTEEQPTKTYNKPTTPQTKTTQSPVETTSTTPSLSEMNIAIEKMATDVAVSGIKNNYSHYNKGGGMSESHADAAYNAVKDLKDQIYNVVSKKSPTIEDKQLTTKLNQKAEKLKQGLVDYKGLVIATSQAYGEGLVNADLSFMGKPNEQMLLKQIMDPKANLGKLGIKAFWKDEEIYYQYGPSQMFMEYSSNKGMEIDPIKLEEQATNVIKGTDLLKMAVLKDIKSENDINAIINKAGDGAIATIGNTQKLLNTDFKRMQATLDSDFRNILNSAETNLLDLFSRDLTIGNSKRNYKKDLLQNPAINALTYSSLGLDKSVDKNNDGVISSDELSEEDRAVVLETLINPRTIAQKEAAISEFSNYCVGLAKQEFDYMRRANQQPSFDPDDLMAKKGNDQKSMLAQDLIAKYSKA